MGKFINAYETLARTSDGKMSFGSPGRRWEDNIKVYLKELCGRVWI
jgi:hypothetical protein